MALNSVSRLLLAAHQVKVADFRSSLGSAEKAMQGVNDARQKSMDNFSKQLQKQNDGLRKEVQSASQAAQSAADAARKVQVTSETTQAQALQMATPGITPPAAQPPYGAMALAPAVQGTDGQEQKPAQIPSGMPTPPSI